MTEAQERDELARTKTSELIADYVPLSLRWQEYLVAANAENRLRDDEYHRMSLLADEIDARIPTREI